MSAPLPPPPPTGREVLEVLWAAGRPLKTGEIHRDVAALYPARRERAMQNTSSLLAALVEAGWGANGLIPAAPGLRFFWYILRLWKKSPHARAWTT